MTQSEYTRTIIQESLRLRNLYLVLEYIVGGEFFTHLRKAGRSAIPPGETPSKHSLSLSSDLRCCDVLTRSLDELIKIGSNYDHVKKLHRLFEGPQLL